MSTLDRWRSGIAWSAMLTLLLVFHAAPAAAQATGTVRGTVVAANSMRPLAGAQVSIPGTGLGTITNSNGQYLIVNVPTGSTTLRVQMIGYGVAEKTAQVSAGETATLNFQLSETAIALDEVVVTGTAAAVRKKEIGNSVEAITAAEIQNTPVQNPQTILQGRTPGVTVMTGGGQPGAGGTVKIRGTNSVSQDVEPLIYVDGVRIFNLPTRAGWKSRTGVSPLQDIPAEDIERIEVVKGAAATTLYGTEASGGVIQIFTKKGVAGAAPIWSAEITQGIMRQGDITPFDDPDQLFTQCGGISRGIITSGKRKGEIQEFMDPTCPADGDWWETGYEQGYSLSVRGGSEDMTYFISGNYGDVDGVLPTSRNREGGFRGNFNFSPLEQISVQVNTAYNRRNTRWVEDGNNNDGFLLNVGRGYRGYYKGGREGDCDAVPDGVICTSNGYLFDSDLYSRADHFILGSTVQYNPTNNLSNRFTIGWDYTDLNNESTHPFGHFDEPQGFFWDENTRHTKLSLDYAGNFQNSFGEALTSSFSWGGQIFRDFHRWTEIDVEGFAGPGEPTLETGAQMTYRAENRVSETSAGFFLQEQLGYQDRLFVTGGVRVDGHSAFGDEFGLQVYPKVSASWVLSDYDFFPTRWWDTFKLRAAVGASGKAPDAFAKFRTWGPVSANEGEPGFTPDEVGNSDVGPERTLEMEGGFDASWLSGRLGLEFTAYRAQTTEALVPVALPPSQGFLSSRLTNVGELETTGLEFALNLGLVRSSALEWDVRGTASLMDSEAVDLDGQEIFADNKAEFREGFPVPTYFGRRVTNPDAIAEPEIERDQELGPVFPTELFGLGTDLTLFNRLTIDALLEYQGGHFLPNYTGYQNARRGVWFPCYDIQQMQVRAARTKDTSELDAAGITALQRARCSIDDHNSDFWVEPADFAKLRYVSMTYQVPNAWVRFADNASITLAARNLFTWTDYSGTDPEVEDFADRSASVFDGSGDFGRRDYYTIPAPRSLLLSFRVTF